MACAFKASCLNQIRGWTAKTRSLPAQQRSWLEGGDGMRTTVDVEGC